MAKKTQLTLQEVTLPLCEVGTVGPTRMQVQRRYDAYRQLGHSIRLACREVERELNIQNVQTDVAGKTIVFFTESAADDIVGAFIGMKISRCPTCRNLLAHRGGVPLPCTNPKCPDNPKNRVDEAYKSITPAWAWTVSNPGYDFSIVAYTPKGKEVIQHTPSLPRARQIAKEHYKRTRQTVEVYDAKLRKYFRLG